MKQTSREVYNPIQKDSALFVKTVSESNGAHTIIEVLAAPGGCVGQHYHKSYSEKFECLEGTLQVQTGKMVQTLKPADGAVIAEKNTLHRFFNTSDKPCRFRVTISPGSRGFEESIQIAYGLARDGKMTKSGSPKNLYELGVLLKLSETKLPGWQGILERAFLWFGKQADKKGITSRLRKQYVHI